MEFFELSKFIYEPLDDEIWKQKINIQADLGYDFQIDEQCIYTTFVNLYHYFRKADTILLNLDSPFYEDCILSNLENYFEIKLNDEVFYKDLEVFLESKNK